MITSFQVADAAARTRVVERLRRHRYDVKADNRVGSFIVQVRHDWPDDLEAIEALISLEDRSAVRMEPPPER